MPSDLAIELSHVSKQFGSLRAVDEVSLEVPAASVYGFIGPNGSGKTTTLRMVARILHPDSGSVRVLGEEASGACDDRVGYLPEERGLYRQMRVGELLRFHAALKGCRGDLANRAIHDWLERLGLSHCVRQRIETLSKGMAQKIQFIATVLARPRLLLLDEPFSGLDPINAQVLRDAVLDLRREGTTVLFSTHDMPTAERMCDRICMIYRGKKVLDGPLEQIQSTYGSDTIRVEMDGAALGDEPIPGVAAVTDCGRYHELRLSIGADSQAILAELMRRGRVRRFELGHPSLAEIFVRIAAPSDADRALGTPAIDPTAVGAVTGGRHA